MTTNYFRDGNYIYECKTSPNDMGNGINDRSLDKWQRDLRILFEREDPRPSGFRYIFPVNRLSSNNIRVLTKLQENYPDIDIRYYDCDSVDKLINSLNKVNNLPELVEYIENARGK